MASIAIFPCVQTGVEKVVTELAGKMGVRPFTDDDLITQTAEKNGVDPVKLRNMLLGKVSVFNKFTLEKERALALFKVELAEKLIGSEGHLFYGVHTVLLSPEIKEVLRALVVDTKEARITRGEEEGLSQKESKNRVREHDISAFTLTDFLYKKEAFDKSLYDLTIPVNGRDHLSITEEMLEYSNTVSLVRSKESQEGAVNMKLAALIELRLLENGHKLPVAVDGGKAIITVPLSAFNMSKLQEKLSSLAMGVEGISEVDFKKIKTHESNVYRPQKFELPSKVLFVDDEKDFVHAISERLISRDVGTYGVYGGAEALELIHEDSPDVMVLDLKMPGMHGTEVLEKVKKMAPEIEVIILTGHGNIDDEKLCMSLGAYAYLNKPVDINVLSETIKTANEKVLQNKNQQSAEAV